MTGQIQCYGDDFIENNVYFKDETSILTHGNFKGSKRQGQIYHI